MHSFFWSWKALLSHAFTKKDKRIYCDRKSSWGIIVFIASWIIYNINVTVEDYNILKDDSSFRCHLYMISSNVNKNTENFCLDESWVHSKYSDWTLPISTSVGPDLRTEKTLQPGESDEIC